MRARMLSGIGLIAAILISQAHAMNSAPEKPVIKESYRDGDDLLKHGFEFINPKKTILR